MKAQGSTDFSCTVNCKLTIYFQDKTNKTPSFPAKPEVTVKTYTVYKPYANELGRLGHLQVVSKQGHTLTAFPWAAFLVFQSMYLCTMNSLRLSGLQLSPEVDSRDFRLREQLGFGPCSCLVVWHPQGPRKGDFLVLAPPASGPLPSALS